MLITPIKIKVSKQNVIDYNDPQLILGLIIGQLTLIY